MRTSIPQKEGCCKELFWLVKRSKCSKSGKYTLFSLFACKCPDNWTVSVLWFDHHMRKEVLKVTPFTLLLAVLGVCYISWLIMKFIVWLDGADQFALETEDDTTTAKDATTTLESHIDYHRAA